MWTHVCMLDWIQVMESTGLHHLVHMSPLGPTLVDPCPTGAPALARLWLIGHRRGKGPRAWGPQ